MTMKRHITAAAAGSAVALATLLGTPSAGAQEIGKACETQSPAALSVAREHTSAGFVFVNAWPQKTFGADFGESFENAWPSKLDCDVSIDQAWPSKIDWGGFTNPGDE